LKPENIKRALERINPFAVDVSSGVEVSPGIKDARLMKKFFKNANI